MQSTPLRLLVLGAHPDDAEYHAGGLAAAYASAGHVVRFVSATDGAAGHHWRTPEELRRVRSQEARRAAERIGAESETWRFPDGALLPTLELRAAVIRELRTFQPDLVLTHRTCDYHPDHRALGQAVQDASFLTTVPLVVPEAPALRCDPVVACMVDLFTRPAPLRADILFDATPCRETIVQMLACHESQMFEWLPYLQGKEQDVPAEAAAREAWLAASLTEAWRKRCDGFRAPLARAFGARAPAIEAIEVFEISEYAAPFDAAAFDRLFGWLGNAIGIGTPAPGKTE